MNKKTGQLNKKTNRPNIKRGKGAQESRMLKIAKKCNQSKENYFICPTLISDLFCTTLCTMHIAYNYTQTGKQDEYLYS